MPEYKNERVDIALAAQAEQLLGWKVLLKREMYEKLMLHVAECNDKIMKTGYNVFHGKDIDNWIIDNLMKRADVKAPEERPFDIEVCRISYGFRTLTIMAKNNWEAERRALQIAGNYVFSERDADYTVVNSTK